MKRRRDSSIPEAWRFVEKHVPGAFAAWMRDVGDPVEAYELGISGKPSEASFCEDRCRRSYFNDCTRCRAFRGGRWVLVRHLGMPIPVAPGPHVDEHF